ncbi:MAG: hypothetical protein ACO25B_01370 [Chitinophagaceae bacterium]
MNTEKNKRIEDILNSLDGIKRAVPSGFFYTRLKARMEKELLPVPPRSGFLKPAYVFPVLALVLALNAFVILAREDKNPENTPTSERELLQTIAAEYNPADVSSLYDLNEEKKQ